MLEDDQDRYSIVKVDPVGFLFLAIVGGNGQLLQRVNVALQGLAILASHCGIADACNA
jgi:hypothetical protein